MSKSFILLSIFILAGALSSTSISSCQELNSSGSYVLTANASANGSNCFNITASDVIVDCNGFSLIGDNSNGTRGITSTFNGVEVKNCDIGGFEIGIYFNGASNAIITNNTFFHTYNFSPHIYTENLNNLSVTNNYFHDTAWVIDNIGYLVANTAVSYGWLGSAVTNSNISNNTIYDTSINAIYDSGGSGNLFTNNKIENSSAGIYMQYSSNETVSNNYFNATPWDWYTAGNPSISVWIYVTQSSNIIAVGNDILAVGLGPQPGIYVSSTAVNVSILNTNITAVGGNYGIEIFGTNTTVGNTTISSSAACIHVTNAPGTRILDCMLNGTYGVEIHNSNIFISDTNVSYSQYGFYLIDSQNATITGCSVYGNTFGIYLLNTSNSTISNNIVTSTSYSALGLAEASYNTFFGNSFVAPAGLLATSFGNYIGPSVGNIFYSNLFTSNYSNSTLIWFQNTNTSGEENVFYWNNFTSPGLYVNDSRHNHYTHLINGTLQGNYWGNTLDGTLNYTYWTNSSVAGFCIGYLPYNSITSLGKILGIAVDTAPIVTCNYPAVLPTPTSSNAILALIGIVLAVVVILLILSMEVTIENLVAVLLISVIVIQVIIPYLVSH